MTTLETKALIERLQDEVSGMLLKVEHFKTVAEHLLNREPENGKWSVAQILEHLNSYNRYYLPEIEHALQRGRINGIRASKRFHPGWFGNYFTRLMQPSENGDVAKKMKAPKDHTPGASLNVSSVIKEFVEGQNRLIDFLQQAAYTDMGKLKVPISITRLLKLKLGDTFRFLIAHQQRHFMQIETTLKTVSASLVHAAV